MSTWIKIYEGRDENRYEELKSLLTAAGIKFRAKGVNAKQPQGAGIAGQPAQTRVGTLYSGASITESMANPAWRYDIQIRAEDLAAYRALKQ